jgi:hypothetical protein
MISRAQKVANTTGPQRKTIFFSHEALLVLAQESDEQTLHAGPRKTYSDLVIHAVLQTYGNNHHNHREIPSAGPRASPKRKHR